MFYIVVIRSVSCIVKGAAKKPGVAEPCEETEDSTVCMNGCVS